MKISPIKAGIIHFVGIGGIGMSGIAELLFNLGYKIQGSDLSINNPNVSRLRSMGVEIFDGHNESHINNASLLVVSSAIKQDNPEVMSARKKNIPVIKRAEMLCEIMRLRSSIAIAGTHGKTTTTSLVARLLDYAGLDPTVINGGIINAYGTNARLGNGEWLVAEADESDGSFLKLPAQIAVITNIEPEHMDYYKDNSVLLDCFLRFAENIPFYGLSVLCVDDENTRELSKKITDRRVITYGLEKQYNPDILGYDIRINDDGKSVFNVMVNHQCLIKINPNIKENITDIVIEDIELGALGEHNISNTLSAIAIGLELGISSEIIASAFKEFSGVRRRFNTVARTKNNIRIIDDYAHHPTEVRAVLKTADILKQQNQTGRNIAVFQPHRYSRLKSLLDGFAASLLLADVIIITPVYAAGEELISGFDAKTLVSKIKDLSPEREVVFKETTSCLKDYLLSITKKDDNIIFMGAGNITNWACEIAQSFIDKYAEYDPSNNKVIKFKK